jgi:hypothetical protein
MDFMYGLDNLRYINFKVEIDLKMYTLASRMVVMRNNQAMIYCATFVTLERDEKRQE